MTGAASTSRPIERCQLCGRASLESVLFVGFVPAVNALAKIGAPAEEQPSYPLELLRCGACSLVQIGLEVDQQVLFPKSYPYLSGTTRALRENFAELCRDVSAIAELEPSSLVVDIGSNDGTLLAAFQAAGHRVLGIEPTDIGQRARDRGIESIDAFFSLPLARELRAAHGPAHVVTATNVFAHVPDVHDAIEGIVELLGPCGVFVSESHYVLDLVESLQFDAIYHEHARHYSVESLARLFDQHGLELFDVKRISTHGGSIRAYAARRGERTVQPGVAARIAEERSAGLADGSAFHAFRQRVTRAKTSLHHLLGSIAENGERVFGVSAPSRASTLAIHAGLDERLVEAVVEVSSSHKLNTYLPGTRIPVIDERALFAEQPEYALLFSWHITNELSAALRAKGYRGRFIVPLPEPRVLDLA